MQEMGEEPGGGQKEGRVVVDFFLVEPSPIKKSEERVSQSGGRKMTLKNRKGGNPRSEERKRKGKRRHNSRAGKKDV